MDDAFVDRVLERITRITVVLTAAGTVVATAIGGWPAGGGFLLGAGASYLNFYWLKRVVGALGNAAESGKAPRARVAIVLGLRYAIIGAGAYVILKSSVLSLPAALAGLFVSVAAVVFEILFELVYAR